MPLKWTLLLSKVGSGKVKSWSGWQGFSSDDVVTKCEDGSVVVVLVLGISVLKYFVELHFYW